jgi:hypothetical protein
MMKIHKYFWPLVLILLFISAIVYLPLVGSLGYYKDDWFLIYDAHSQGASFFHEIYRIDRPARAYVMQFIYSLFGDRVLLYQLTAYLYHFVAAAALFWSLVKTWPKRIDASFIVSLLFVLYPGFLSQVNAIDYQAQLLSLCLALVSIALTVQAIQTEKLIPRIIYTVLSILLGLAYLPLVEYFIGFEALRLVFIIQHAFSSQKEKSLKGLLAPILRLWLPFLAVPVVFLIWRLFFFETERRATDVSIQLGQLFSSPLTGLVWLLALAEDGIKAIFLAWAIPVYNLAFDLRLRDLLTGLGISALAIAAALAGLWWLARNPLPAGQDETESDWRTQFLVGGLIVAVAGLLPVIMVNRRADFGDYSRYLLASAAGAAMVATALIYLLENKHVRTVFISLLVLAATLTHYSNAVQAVQETRNRQDFWWQVSWRVPDIQTGTTLVADYPVGAIQEDYFVWGPANLIYQPQKQNQIPIEIKLPAAVLTDDTVLQILRGKGTESQLRRGNDVVRDFGNVLVLTQASPASCVRVIDGKYPELSERDQQRIMLVAPKSKIENVLVSGESPTPPVQLFGAEPAHGWCYYYQKVALARQAGDWKSVAALGEKALAEGFYPSDKIEWMPFLQAYVSLGQKDKLHRFVSIMGESPFIQKQVCTTLSANTSDPVMLAAIQESFCK